MVPILIRVLAFGFVGFIVYRIVRPSYPVHMTLTSDGVMHAKGVSQNARRMVDEFARKQLFGWRDD